VRAKPFFVVLVAFLLRALESPRAPIKTPNCHEKSLPKRAFCWIKWQLLLKLSKNAKKHAD
jgi:hypothetical protein